MKNEMIVLACAALLAVGSGGMHLFLQSANSSDLTSAAFQSFESGDYETSLANFNTLKKETDSPGQTVLVKIEESKDLLVAKEIFEIAKKAADQGEWLEVKALLERSAATTNTSFHEYQEAVALYVTAAEKVRSLEKKIVQELSALKQEALAEKKGREEVLHEVSVTKKELESTLLQKEQTEAALQVQKSETIKAKEEAEKEKIKKFGAELGVYVGMLTQGREYLDNAIVEIDAGKDATPPILISQGKVLFTEVKEKGENLLASRTPETHKEQTQKLLQAVALFIESSRGLGSAVLYMDNKEDPGFTVPFAKGKRERNDASQIVSGLQTFISSLQ